MVEDPEERLVAVVLAGGRGTRFWPLSTASRPKQFVELFGGHSLLQETVERVGRLVPPERLLVLTGETFVDLARGQLPSVPPENVIGEPTSRDTAAAVALAARVCRLRFPGSVMLMVPADARIRQRDRFQRAVRAAVREAERSGTLYTFGIPPSRPAVAYGYLKVDELLTRDGGVDHLRVVSFKEKPDIATAREFLRAGSYLWNSGMFVWTSDRIWEALERNLPDHARRLEEVPLDPGGRPVREALIRALEPLDKVSIDHGVLEHEEGIRTIRAAFDWNDVGGWRSLATEFLPDGDGNRGQGVIRTRNSQGCFVFCKDPDEVVALLGVDDLVVVRAGSRTLVARRSRLAEMREFVNEHLSSPEIEAVESSGVFESSEDDSPAGWEPR